MAIDALPLFSMLKVRMHWHQARQKLIAENVANADTPNFKPRDLREAAAGAMVGGMAGGLAGGLAGTWADDPGPAGMMRTDAAHIAAIPGSDEPGSRAAQRFEATPSGNAVVLEEEMLKAAQNQADYQLAVTLYAKSLSLLKTAIGKRA